MVECDVWLSKCLLPFYMVLFLVVAVFGYGELLILLISMSFRHLSVCEAFHFLHIDT